MRKLILPIFVFAVLFITTETSSQKLYDVEGYFKVGNTGCTITWDTYDKVFKVYWDNGTGYTFLYYSGQLMDNTYQYDEYDSGGSYTGSFNFLGNHDWGFYTRADGKKFDVTR